jgi:hypothetical protein
MAEIDGPDIATGAFPGRFLSLSPLCCRHRITFPKVDDLFNIMNQTVKHPLDIYLDPTSQREPVHPFACLNVSKDRLYNPQPFAINATSIRCIDLLFHLIRNAARTLPIEHMNLSRFRVWIAQTFGTQSAISACRLRSLVRNGLVSVECDKIPVL